MVEIKGKFISLAASLMSLYPDKLKLADQQLVKEIGEHWDQLDPEGWYNVKYYNDIISAYENASPSKDLALITLGKKIYPTIKKTVGFPPNLNTLYDYIEFENKSYQENLRGPGIQSREIIKEGSGHMVVQTKMIEQDCRILEGIYLGMMKMIYITEGDVYQKRCITKGDPFCEFHIKWNPR